MNLTIENMFSKPALIFCQTTALISQTLYKHRLQRVLLTEGNTKDKCVTSDTKPAALRGAELINKTKLTSGLSSLSRVSSSWLIVMQQSERKGKKVNVDFRKVLFDFNIAVKRYYHRESICEHIPKMFYVCLSCTALVLFVITYL